MKRNFRFSLLTLLAFVLLLNTYCAKEKELSPDNNEVSILGFSFLEKITGLWHGPVTSETPAGNFDMWYVDFRPVSESQTSHFSLLDTNTINNFSFLVIKHNGKHKIAMRTEGCFRAQCCITYEVLDSVNASNTYYRFSDFVAGPNRAHTEFIFNDDELIMRVFTNKFNTVSPPEIHTEWIAKSGGRSNATEAISRFNYPKATPVRDFTGVFQNMQESIFYTFDNDPYKSEEQPEMGSVNVTIAIDSALTMNPDYKILVLFTTESLFNGYIYKAENLKYISKYVYLTAETSAYTFRNVHLGSYFLYSFVDVNNDNLYLSGDYMNSNFNHTFSLTSGETLNVTSVIDYVIP